MKDKQIVLLVDCDNVRPHYLEAIIHETSKMGKIQIKMGFGDFSSPILKNYVNYLSQYSIKPVMNISKNKNSTDISLVIEAMHILYNKKEVVDTLVLVTSDADFTSLVTTYQEHGLDVIGIGETKSNGIFKNSYTNFISLDDLDTSTNDLTVEEQNESLSKNSNLIVKLTIAVLEVRNEDDKFADLLDVGHYISENYDGFSPYKYGHTKLVHLFKSIDRFEVHYSEDRKKAFVRIKQEHRFNSKKEEI